MPSYLCSEIVPDWPLISFFAKFVLDQFAHRFHSFGLVRAFGYHLDHGPPRRGEEQDSEDVLRVHRPRLTVSAGPGRRSVAARLYARQQNVAAECIRQLDQLGRRPRVQPQTIGNAKCDSSHLSQWGVGKRGSEGARDKEMEHHPLPLFRSPALPLSRSLALPTPHYLGVSTSLA